MQRQMNLTLWEVMLMAPVRQGGPAIFIGVAGMGRRFECDIQFRRTRYRVLRV
jgi:hypothetical protein